jgi:hypothetical protein
MKNYLTSWLLLDLLAVFPFDLLSLLFLPRENSAAAAQDNVSDVFKLFRVPRLYRLIRIARMFKMLKKAK